MVAYNTTAACGNIQLGYYCIRAPSDRLHVRGELFGEIDAHHH